jgi:ABC-2 type transport system permease protein
VFPFILDSFEVTIRLLTELKRNRRLLIFWVMFPTLMLLLFGWVYADEYGSLGDSFTWTAPGILLGAAMFFSCLSGTVSFIVGERERRTLRRLLLSPISGAAYFLGVVWAHLAISAGQTIIVYGITVGMGGGFEGSIALGILVVLLSAMSYVGLGFFFGARFARSTEDATGAVAAIGVPLLVLGGTFFPADILPPFLLSIAQLDPIYHMNEALKAVARTGAGLEAISTHVLFLCVFSCVSLSLGANAYRKIIHRERGA